MKNKKIITLLILIIISAIVGTILIVKKNNTELKEDTFYKHENVETEEERLKEEELGEEQEEEITCAETIDAEFVGKHDSDPKEEVTITLSKDGIYEKKITEGEYQRGYYQIINNIINFEFIPSGAPVDAKTAYYYKISDDCSQITIRNNDFSYIAYRK